MSELTVGRVEFSDRLERARVPVEPPLTKFKSGATSSHKAKRYDLIPFEVLECLADRLGLGAVKHGDNAWRQGLNDLEFMLDRDNHAVEHFFHALAKTVNEDGDNEWDNLGAVMWWCMLRAVALKAKKV